MCKLVRALDAGAVRVMRESGGAPQRIAVEHARRLQAVVAQLGSSQLPNAKRQRVGAGLRRARRTGLADRTHPPWPRSRGGAPPSRRYVASCSTWPPRWCIAFAEAVGADAELLQEGRAALQALRQTAAQAALASCCRRGAPRCRHYGRLRRRRLWRQRLWQCPATRRSCEPR